MRLTPEEVVELNRYLFNALGQKGFDVKLSTKSGYIKSVSKLGVNSLPGICHSYVDGKQEYSYMCLTAGTVDSSDLGYYCLKETDCALVKYSQANPVKIDIRNYRRILDTFVKDLDDTYTKYVKGKVKLESKLSRVKIKSTGDIFDGKEGVLEEDKGDTLTVLVNFDDKGRKVRQYFKKENVEYLKSETLLEDAQKETINEEEGEVDLEIIPITDNKILALANAIEVDPALIVRNDDAVGRESSSDYGKNLYIVMNEDQAEYLVLDSKQAEDMAYHNAREFYESGDANLDEYTDYIDMGGLRDIWEDSERDRIDYDTDSDVFESAVSEDILSEDDFAKDENGNPDYERPKENFDVEDIRDKLLEARLKLYSSPLEWLEDTYGRREVSTFLSDNNLFDFDAIASNDIENNGCGNWLAPYNYKEIDLEIQAENGLNIYAYRVA
jgi:hypothetical protein